MGQGDEVETGSGHLNTGEFSTGVFYRYASVNVEDLLTNLEGDEKLAHTLLKVFAEEFLMSLPQAKRTSTAPHTIPDLAYLAVRRRRPVSFAAAFETPVTADRSGGFSVPSRKKLSEYAQQVERLTAGRGLAFHGYAGIDEPDGDELSGLGKRRASFAELIDAAVGVSVPDTVGAPQ
jgi:CRISPR system Cascade subunit CasC